MFASSGHDGPKVSSRDVLGVSGFQRDTIDIYRLENHDLSMDKIRFRLYPFQWLPVSAKGRDLGLIAMDALFGSSFPFFTGMLRVTSLCDGSTIGQWEPSGVPIMILDLQLPWAVTAFTTSWLRARMIFFTSASLLTLGGWGVDESPGDLSPRVVELCAGVGGME